MVVLVVGGCAKHRGPGTIEGTRVPQAIVADRAVARSGAAGKLAGKVGIGAPDKQVLFGDLHVHTTYSSDAFLMSLPMLQGDGAHPIADACDYARHCSALDFWSINDHAESMTPRNWIDTKESIRQCNALAGDPDNPDMVSFLGWEWTEAGIVREDHYGHKNVILLDTEEDKVPTRPIHAGGMGWQFMRQKPTFAMRYLWPIVEFPNRQHYLDFVKFRDDLRAVPLCEEGIDSRELPSNCQEIATTPAVLFEKLDQWGFDTIVIPHGNTWGLYTPTHSTWHKQLAAGNQSPDKQFLVEIFSGHGNSEEYRSWRPELLDSEGQAYCPEPTNEFVPCCWQAGEIIRSRCDDPVSETCEEAIEKAKADFIANQLTGRTMTLPGTDLTDWLDCGNCRDCYLPAFNYRPSSSVQSAVATTHFEEDGTAKRFRFGFMASSDNHTGRPGTGYKEFARFDSTEARGSADEGQARRLRSARSFDPPEVESIRLDLSDPGSIRINLGVADFERQASFFTSGGLVAVHSEGRARGQIWNALKKKEVYGTSGPRILLWFDLLNAGGGPAVMGSDVLMSEVPRFRVRAAGSLEQLPGCPGAALDGLSSERLEKLCRSECYNPGDKRRAIARVEVVRIRPQVRFDEAMEDLIDDPWKVFDCPANGDGCVVEFDDPDYPAQDREVVYYVRAIEEPSLAVNAGQLRCTLDDEGNCVEVNPCYGDYRSDYDDDCLAPNEERAWSSPIYVRKQ